MKSTMTTQPHRTLAASIGAGALALCLCAELASTALGQNNNSGIFKQNSDPYDVSYGEWAAAWQQWAFGVPATQSPLLDETGAFAAVGQSGPVWFLTGNFGGRTVRNITVPKSKALFFPVVNSFFVRTEPTEPTDLESIRSLLQGFLVDASYSCEIDGRSVANLAGYYTESPLFDQSLGIDNLFGLDPGVYSPAMTLGYYLMVKPLKAGAHTIRFSGYLPVFEFGLEVTYNITVE